MNRIFFGLLFTIFATLSSTAIAQQNFWVQVEAKRSLTDAQTRAREYSSRLQNVNGFATSSGWYGIALGPFSRSGADSALRQLRATGQIPNDSYIAFTSGYRSQFWPVGASSLTAQPLTAPSTTPQVIEPVALPLIPSEETVGEARASERALNREERELLQVAMKWDGFYQAAIDGSFGRGTRAAMSAWQEANAYEATGVLTSKQRVQLVGGYTKMLASIGLFATIDDTAGVELEMPTTLVKFDRYEPPFAHYSARDETGVKVLLISQTGDLATLRGLYDIMQTLDIVPLEGERSIGKNSFTLTGANAEISSYTYAQTRDGEVKGFTLIWPAGVDRRRELAVTAMRNSFRSLEGSVLPDVYGDPNAAQSIDLLAGLAIRKPDLSRSGFYVNGVGDVLTTASAVASCNRITLDDLYDAELVASDAASGLSLLRPKQSLEPISYARFLPGIPRLNTEVSVSGYSYEGVLDAPTLTYGTLADLRGLKGETNVKRLSLTPSVGDAGGPVFDLSGSVMGMLMPLEQDGAQRLPEGVSFALDAPLIISFLSNNGVTPAASDAVGTIAPEDLTIAAADMTVLVSCWN